MQCTATGCGGANVTWDFSSITTNNSVSISYVNCSATPQCSSFPGSTVATEQAGNTIYLITSSTQQSLNGVYAGITTLYYSNPEDYLRFPFTYNTSFTDTFASTFVSGSTYYRKGTAQVTGDAYGTLKLPTGTFTNILRVHRHEVYKDSSIISSSTITDAYNWYSTTNKELLLSLGTSTINTNGNINTYSSGVYTNQIPSGIADLNGIASSLQIAPNPATEAVNISFKPEQATTLQIELFDITGRRVQELSNNYNKGDHTVKIDVTTLPKGMYLLKLNSEGQAISRKVNVI